MTRKNIITLPNPKLREVSLKIAAASESVQKLADNMMAATLDWEDHRAHEIGVALAAVQIGELRRLIVVRNDYKNKVDRTFKSFINPKIIKTEGEPVFDPEGCLSVQDVYGLVPRYPKVKIRAQTITGKPIRFSVKGFLARIFQHEIDHLDGRLFIDRVQNNKYFRLDSEGELIPIERSEYKQLHISHI